MSGTQADPAPASATEPVTTILPVHMANALRERAERGERSLSAELRLAVRAHLADAA